MKNNPLLKFIGSFGLACVLLLCLFFLTFQGTLYQVDHGLYEAKQIYFNSWFVTTEGGLPYFPGGVLVMLTLTINLIVGGLMRIKWRQRNAGVLIIHFGIIFMLVAGLVKLVDSEEGHLTLYEGQQSDQFVSYHLNEATIWELGQNAQVPQWVIGDDFLSDLTDGGERSFHAKDLPFTLVLSDYLPNCNALPKGPNWQAKGKVIDGYGLLQLPKEKENEMNTAGMHAKVIAKDGSEQEALLWGRQQAPWAFEVDGRQFAVSFGHAAYDMPYAIHLDKFIKEDHPGISMAKAYKSRVTKIDQDGAQPILIQMNEPLREGGLVLFQASYGPSTPGYDGPFYSVFSVVQNPSDKWPEYSLWVITLGLILTFGRHLFGFISQQTKLRRQAAGEQS